MNRIPTPRWDDVVEGADLPVIEKPPVSTRQLVMYAGASGDFYEVHYDKDFAAASGLPSVIVHGMMKASFLGELITSWAGEGVLKSLNCQYRGMDVAGDGITLRGKVVRKYQAEGERLVDLEVWTESGKGERTTPAKATVALPE